MRSFTPVVKASRVPAKGPVLVSCSRCFSGSWWGGLVDDLACGDCGKTTFREVFPVIDEFEVAFEGRVCIFDTLENVEHAYQRSLAFDVASRVVAISGVDNPRFPAFFVGYLSACLDI